MNIFLFIWERGHTAGAPLVIIIRELNRFEKLSTVYSTRIVIFHPVGHWLIFLLSFGLMRCLSISRILRSVFFRTFFRSFYSNQCKNLLSNFFFICVGGPSKKYVGGPILKLATKLALRYHTIFLLEPPTQKNTKVGQQVFCTDSNKP